MPWTEAARREYRRDMRRYASDLTDGEWGLIERFMPPPSRIGRPRTAEGDFAWLLDRIAGRPAVRTVEAGGPASAGAAGESAPC